MTPMTIFAGKSHDSDGGSDRWTAEESDWAWDDGSGRAGGTPDLIDYDWC